MVRALLLHVRSDNSDCRYRTILGRLQVAAGAGTANKIEAGVEVAAEVETETGAGAAVAETGIGAVAGDVTATAQQQTGSTNAAVARG
jgi:hypothetical protein